MKTTQAQFLEICNAHGILAPDSVLKAVFKDVLAIERGDAKTHELIARYCECFKARYGTNPPITKKTSGIAKRLVLDLGVERAKAMIETYLQMGGFFEMKRHDLGVFEMNLTTVQVQMDTGKAANRVQIQQGEKKDANRQAIRDYLEDERGTE